MDGQTPVGSNCPPCESAPKQENPLANVPTAQGIDRPVENESRPAIENNRGPAPLYQAAAPMPNAPHPTYAPPQPGGLPYGYGGPAGTPGGGAPKAPHYTAPSRQPFFASPADALFVIYTVILGFLFMRWLLYSGWRGWGVSAFTLLYAGGTLLYAGAKRVQPPKSSWFWLAVLLGTGLAYALWPPSANLALWQGLLLLGAAVYWVGSLFGGLLQGKTGNQLPLDMLNLVFVVPFRNYDGSMKAAGGFGKPGKKGGRKRLARLWPVLLGLGLCVVLLAMVLPGLMTADSANFGRLMNNIADAFRDWKLWEYLNENLAEVLAQLLLGLPVAWYLCGLLCGLAHRRYTGSINAARVQKMGPAIRRLPMVTVLMVLGAACGVYLLFIGCQLPHFFSAFGGKMPQNHTLYSEYAREGFFELCRIATINLVLLALANCLSVLPPKQHIGLRVLNIGLCALTLLVIVTAFSKMALYINQHGFTQKRIMTCVFMVFLAGVCLAVMVLQRRHFSVVRFAAVWGASLLCALCLCNLDGLVVRYNASRWQNDTLPTFDEVIVQRSGVAGVQAALKVYQALPQRPARGQDAFEQQRLRLEYVLCQAGDAAQNGVGTSRDTQAAAAVRALDLPWPESHAEEERRLEAFLKEHYPGTWEARYG